MCMTLTIVCLEGLGLDHLAAVVAHHQVKVVLCGVLAEDGHVCTQGNNQKQDRRTSQGGAKKIDLHSQTCCHNSVKAQDTVGSV